MTQKNTPEASPAGNAPLKSFRHRVANNLQVLLSLMGLQSRQLKDPEAKRLFRGIYNRIVAMSHSTLYGAEELSRADFSSYLNDLISKLVASFGHEVPSVQFMMDVRTDSFPVEAALPCGLLINELVSNALMHAFPGGRSGEIHVQLCLEGPQTFRIVVRDNGVGFPPSLDYRNTETLGFQVVMLLADQLGATVDVVRDAGTTVHIRCTNIPRKT